MASVRRGVVNHFAVFGLPGIKDGVWRMNVPKSHSYALEFKDDVIRKTNALKNSRKQMMAWGGMERILQWIQDSKSLIPTALQPKKQDILVISSTEERHR